MIQPKKQYWFIFRELLLASLKSFLVMGFFVGAYLVFNLQIWEGNLISIESEESVFELLITSLLGSAMMIILTSILVFPAFFGITLIMSIVVLYIIKKGLAYSLLSFIIFGAFLSVLSSMLLERNFSDIFLLGKNNILSCIGGGLAGYFFYKQTINYEFTTYVDDIRGKGSKSDEKIENLS